MPYVAASFRAAGELRVSERRGYELARRLSPVYLCLLKCEGNNKGNVVCLESASNKTATAMTSAEMLAQARKYHRSRDMVRTEALCRQILAMDPQNAEALYLVGICCHAAGRLGQAVTHYQEALRLNPGLPDVGNDLGVALVMQNRMPEATAAFERVLQHEPDHAFCHINLGNALRMQGRLEEAIAHYRAAITLRPDYAPAHNNLGLALVSHGQPDQAMMAFHQALRISPNYAEAFVNHQKCLRSNVNSLQSFNEARVGAPPGLDDLQRYERAVYSQNGEDGVLQAIFATIGVANKYFVEFGCEQAIECNCSYLVEQDWQGLFMDGKGISRNPHAVVHKEFITAENINALFRKYAVPPAFDLLSIDIDGNDYWVWKEIAWRPRVVVIEYNAHFPPPQRKTIRYEPMFSWNQTDYFGASLHALRDLGEQKGYTLVYCESTGSNAFFIATDVLPPSFVPQPVEVIYRPPNYMNRGQGFPRDPDRTMIDPLQASGTPEPFCGL